MDNDWVVDSTDLSSSWVWKRSTCTVIFFPPLISEEKFGLKGPTYCNLDQDPVQLMDSHLRDHFPVQLLLEFGMKKSSYVSLFLWTKNWKGRGKKKTVTPNLIPNFLDLSLWSCQMERTLSSQQCQSTLAVSLLPNPVSAPALTGFWYPPMWTWRFHRVQKVSWWSSWEGVVAVTQQPISPDHVFPSVPSHPSLHGRQSPLKCGDTCPNP